MYWRQPVAYKRHTSFWTSCSFIKNFNLHRLNLFLLQNDQKSLQSTIFLFTCATFLIDIFCKYSQPLHILHINILQKKQYWIKIRNVYRTYNLGCQICDYVTLFATNSCHSQNIWKIQSANRLIRQLTIVLLTIILQWATVVVSNCRVRNCWVSNCRVSYCRVSKSMWAIVMVCQYRVSNYRSEQMSVTNGHGEQLSVYQVHSY